MCELLDAGDRHIGVEQIPGEGMSQPVGGERDPGLLAIQDQPIVDGGGGQAVQLIAKKNKITGSGRAHMLVFAQGAFGLRGEIHRPIARALAASDQAREIFIEI